MSCARQFSSASLRPHPLLCVLALDREVVSCIARVNAHRVALGIKGNDFKIMTMMTVTTLTMYATLFFLLPANAVASLISSATTDSFPGAQAFSEEDALRSCYDFVSDEASLSTFSSGSVSSRASRLDLMDQLESALGILPQRRRSLAPVCTLNGEYAQCMTPVYRIGENRIKRRSHRMGVARNSRTKHYK